MVACMVACWKRGLAARDLRRPAPGGGAGHYGGGPPERGRPGDGGGRIVPKEVPKGEGSPERGFDWQVIVVWLSKNKMVDSN